MNSLKTIRQDKNMTQQALGDAVGITATSISRYEIGKRNMSVNMAKKIAEVLCVDWTILYGEYNR